MKVLFFSEYNNIGVIELNSCCVCNLFIVDKLYPLVLEGKTFTSCKEIQVKNNITKDGDYYLNIKGRIIKVLWRQLLFDFSIDCWLWKNLF